MLLLVLLVGNKLTLIGKIKHPVKRMTKIRQLLFNVVLVIASCLMGVVGFEIGWSYLKPGHLNIYSNKYVLLSGEQGVFKNVESFYLYQPNSEIKNITYFDTIDGWRKEYEYKFRTNNYGLVQTSDLQTENPSILLLGDSFTEGSGAEPWFEKVAPELLKHNVQPINGGIMGTGFAQWRLLHDYLKRNNVKIDKVMVVFISDDFRRDIWNFKNQVFQCLSDYRKCEGPEYYYQSPPEGDRIHFLEKMKTFRQSKTISFSVKETLRRLFPNTSELIYRFIRAKAAMVLPASFYSGYDPVKFFTNYYGKNVTFVHIPQKNELGRGPDDIGRLAREVIQNHNGNLYDGFQKCGLEPSDYYVNDNHPNQEGYRKIAECVLEASTEVF